jgi:hypothetical protein
LVVPAVACATATSALPTSPGARFELRCRAQVAEVVVVDELGRPRRYRPYLCEDGDILLRPKRVELK